MSRAIAVRVLTAVLAVVGASVISFVFLRLTPGNPARLVLGQFATPTAMRQLTAQMGLNQPVWEQYVRYIGSFARGDWGFSYSNGTPVRTLLAQRFPASVELGLYAFVFAFLGAITLALIATYRTRKGVDHTVQAVTFIGLGVPEFWLGLMLLVLFSEKLRILPGPEGRLSPHVAPPTSITGLYTVDAVLTGNFPVLVNALWHLILPAFVLGFASLAFLTRLLRANLLDVSREPFILASESQGSSRWRAFTRHALPNAFIPTLTASGMIFSQLLAGGVLVETVFQWPGVGALVTNSVQQQDYSVVQAFILITAIAYVIINLIVDLLVIRLDPRVRTAEG
jgi:ABC-type dipeptide/oligopeptide/nickel transport system permease component